MKAGGIFRKSIRRSGRGVNVAADVNIAVDRGEGAATSSRTASKIAQHSSRKGGRSSHDPDRESQANAERKEKE
ncbi:MAG: hypothetical protein ACRDSJ_14180 [Rubrobacteraceae bacterium]